MQPPLGLARVLLGREELAQESLASPAPPEAPLQGLERMRSEYTTAEHPPSSTNSDFFSSRISSLVSLPWLTFLPDCVLQMGFVQNSQNPNEADSDPKQACSESRRY
jgi:hypothetical protein